MNCFFHKTYWTSWLANFHATKRRSFNVETRLLVGLLARGFTSVDREGFVIVLFLQALVLEGWGSNSLPWSLLSEAITWQRVYEKTGSSHPKGKR